MSPLRQLLDEVVGKVGTAYREAGAGDGAAPVPVAVARGLEHPALQAVLDEAS